MKTYKITDHISYETIEQLMAEPIKLELSLTAKKAIKQNRDYLDRKLKAAKDPIYGINTGFGSLHNKHIADADLEKLQENLDKNEKHLQQAEQVEANREKYEKRLEEIKERQRKQQEKAIEVSKKRAEYQRKLDEAEKHRQQLENENANRKQTADTPLPKPRPEDMPK